MDEQITGNEQAGGNQIDISVNQSDTGIIAPETNVTSAETEGKQISNVPEVIEYLRKQEEKENPPVETPKPIKIREKEYTQEQLEEIIKKTETPEIPEQKQEPQIRDIEVIDNEYETLEGQAVSDLKSVFDRFVARTENQPLAVAALLKATQTKDYSEFIEMLPSKADAIEFLESKMAVEDKYTPQLTNLSTEKERTHTEKEFRDNTSKWDTFISEKTKDNPAAQHFFNFGKNTAIFNEEFATEALQKFNEAVALAINSKELQSQTKAIKQAMMDSSISQAPTSEQKIFTRADIKAMTSQQFLNCEKTIFEQIGKGLIK